MPADLPLFKGRTLPAAITHNFWFLKVFGSLFLAFAAITLVLASVGIYAVVAQHTARRTREIGIRMVLGATSGRVVRQMLNRGHGPARSLPRPRLGARSGNLREYHGAARRDHGRDNPGDRLPFTTPISTVPVVGQGSAENYSFDLAPQLSISSHADPTSILPYPAPRLGPYPRRSRPTNDKLG